MKTIPFHLCAVLWGNQNSFTWNFSLKSQRMIFPCWRSRLVLFSPCSFSQALDPALQLVSRDRSPAWERVLPKGIAHFIEFCYSIRSGICHPGVPAELWETWVWRVVAMGTKQCPALHRDTRNLLLLTAEGHEPPNV